MWYTYSCKNVTDFFLYILLKYWKIHLFFWKKKLEKEKEKILA